MADAIVAVCHTCQHEIEAGSLDLEGDDPLIVCPLCNSMHIDIVAGPRVIDLTDLTTHG